MVKNLSLILALGIMISACEPCYVSMGSNTGTISTGECDEGSGILPRFNPFQTNSTVTSGN